MIVEFHHQHNHPINTPDVLRKRDVSDATRTNLIQLFDSGYSPSEALSVLKYGLLNDCPEEEVETKLADRSILPDIYYIHRYRSYTVTTTATSTVSTTVTATSTVSTTTTATSTASAKTNY